jgi:hypothetical protein
VECFTDTGGTKYNGASPARADRIELSRIVIAMLSRN